MLLSLQAATHNQIAKQNKLFYQQKTAFVESVVVLDLRRSWMTWLLVKLNTMVRGAQNFPKIYESFENSMRQQSG
jgi:hypothetical protein